jgi:hypothetical protein
MACSASESEVLSASGRQLDSEDDDGDSFDPSAVGTMPSERKIEGIMERLKSQLDILSRTAQMMRERMNYLQEDIRMLQKANALN